MLPGTKVVEPVRHLASPAGSAGEESVVVVPVRTSDKGKGRRDVLEAAREEVTVQDSLGAVSEMLQFHAQGQGDGQSWGVSMRG